MEIIQTIKECHKYWNTYDNWENKNKEKYAKKKCLFDEYKKNNPEEVKKLKEKSDIVLRTVNILDNASENAAQNMQVAVKAVAALPAIPAILVSYSLFFTALIKSFKQVVKTGKMPFYFYSLPLIFTLPWIVEMPFTVWSTKKQIEASRVARAKAREKELKDIRNFVIYTPEQIQEAKEKAKLIDNKEIKNEDNQNITVTGSYKTILNLDKEYNKYLKHYYKNLGIDKNMQKKLSEDYTDKELLEANKDKELILTEIKEINNNAEKYCENAEASIATLQMFNFLLIVPTVFVINKILNLFIKNKTPNTSFWKKWASALIPIILSFPIVFYFNNKTKEAAKVGRYKMKQKFQKDLSKGVYFDKKELKKTDVTCQNEKLNIFQRTIRNFKFIPQYLKERNEYLEYKKTQWLEEEKFYKALKDIPITEEQKKEAEKLQKKVFFVFDELDEMSQKYSEHMEGFIELAKSCFKYAKMVSLIAIPIFSIALLLSGNFKITTIGKKISDFLFDKNSNMKKNIDEIYNIAKQDKTIKDKIDRALSIKASVKLNLLNEPKIAKPLRNIIDTFMQLVSNPDARKIFFEKELKHGIIANYLKNLTADILKNTAKKLQEMAKNNIKNIDNPKMQESMQKLNNIKIDTSNLKTLKRTTYALVIPVFAGAVGINYLLNSFFAHLQKKAGYIGVMKSINKLDKTKYFAIHENEENDKNISDWDNFNKKYFPANCV